MANSGRQHLAEAGMGYGGHLMRAWRIGGAMLVAGGACIVHGLLPSLFTDKATRTIRRLNEEVKASAPHKAPEAAWLEFEI